MPGEVPSLIARLSRKATLELDRAFVPQYQFHSQGPPVLAAVMKTPWPKVMAIALKENICSVNEYNSYKTGPQGSLTSNGTACKTDNGSATLSRG